MNDSLFIYPQDDTKLPYDYHFSHNFCVRLYDDLVWVLKDEKTQKKINVEVNLKPKDKGKNLEESDNILEWLKEKGYESELDNIVSKHLTFSIISDICHFIYQALNSTKNIKLTVAFTLIRKPFLENLLIIEQLLCNEIEFLRKFESDASNFDPGKLKPDEKKKLIEDSLNKVNNNFFLDTDIIYQLRWDKKNSNSIYAMSNLATHLVTTRNSSYKTNNQNLNFIFSGYNEWDSQLNYFYYYIPYLLFYMLEIIDQYLLDKKIITLKIFKERKFIRLQGIILQYEQFSKSKSSSTLAKELKVKCNNCNKKNQLYKSDLFTLVNDDYILCKFCLRDLFRETKSMDKIINKLIKK